MNNKKMILARLYCLRSLAVIMALAAICCCSCKKERAKRFSTWWIDSDSISTNNVAFEASRVWRNFYSPNPGNQFNIYIGQGTLPDTDFLTISNAPSPKMTVTYNNKVYGPSKDKKSYFTYVLDGGGITITLHPTTFVAQSDSTDSISIRGQFSTP